MKRAVAVVALVSLAAMAGADSPSWPCWRGANRDGISTETGWNPLALKNGPEVLWTADVGPGYSDVAIQDGRLYTMGMDEEKCSVVCVAANTGELNWRYSFKAHAAPMATPAVDGDRVYAVAAGGDVICLRGEDGTLLWKRHLLLDLKAKMPYYGWADSPLVDGQLLLLNGNRAGIALDKLTGEVVWTSPNDSLKWSAGFGAYASPVPVDFQGSRCVLLYGPAALNLVETATGKVLRTFVHRETNHPLADPILRGSQTFISLPFPALLDLEPGEPHVLWKSPLEMDTGISTAVLVDGHLYGCQYGGRSFPDLDWGSLQRAKMPLRCLDWDTGKPVWDSEGMGSFFLTASDRKLILLEHNGTLRIVEASPAGYNELSSADVLKGAKRPRRFVTAPVLCGGLIYCRNYAGDLVCIDVRK